MGRLVLAGTQPKSLSWTGDPSIDILSFFLRLHVGHDPYKNFSTASNTSLTEILLRHGYEEFLPCMFRLGLKFLPTVGVDNGHVIPIWKHPFLAHG